MKKLFVVVMLALISSAVAQEKVAVKPSAPRSVGPPPLPIESDVLRFVFDHFPDENKEEVMDFIGRNFKSDLPEFRKLSRTDARKASVYMIDLVNEALVLMDIEKKDKQLASMMIKQKELERRAERKAKELRVADEKEQKQLTKELRDILEEAFDVKQKIMERDLAGMQAELEKLDKMIAKRNEHRDKIIEKKLAEMSGDERYLEW